MAKPAEKTTTEVDAKSPETHGSNYTPAVENAIVEYFKESVDIDVERRRLTKRKGRARAKLKDMGLDTKAIDARYAFHKQKNHERDGYSEAASYADRAIANGKNGDLFAALYDVENAD